MLSLTASRPARNACPVRSARSAACAVLTLLLAGCGGPEAPQSTAAEVDPRLSVYAVNYPLAWFAERIGGDAVRVTLPVPGGTDPARWQPGPEAIAGLRDAELLLLNGAGYAPWVTASGLPNNRLVDTSRGFRDRLIRLDAVGGEEDTPALPGAMATHTWLDPALAVEQARAVLDALLTYRPARANEFRAHLTLLERDLQALDAELSAAFSALGEGAVLFARPIYQYVERRYVPGARTLPLDPDRVPDTADLAALRAMLAERPARLVIWDRAPYAVTVAMLEAEGLRSIVFATGANRPAQGDLLDVMAANLANLERVASPAPDEPAPAD
jgi:zinc transport system substrate-binding protein